MDFEEIVTGKRTITVAKQDVVLDTSKMQFTEVTLSKYMEQEAVWYDYFGQRLADAEYESQYFENKYETIYAETFAKIKEATSGSDNLVKSKATIDAKVLEAKEDALTAKYKLRAIQQHLRAWDKAHENAQSRGHTLRKEMDKLHSEHFSKQIDVGNAELDEIIGGGGS